jgi:hypothetical protein
MMKLFKMRWSGNVACMGQTTYGLEATCEHGNELVRFEVSTAVTMKNAVFGVIKTQFVLHRRHITSPLQSPAG